TESTNKGRKFFDLSENNVALGNEALNRATGSFKNGIPTGTGFTLSLVRLMVSILIRAVQNSLPPLRQITAGTLIPWK
ncbi:hypothetical protein CYK81_15495, partial [Clostridium perfringens]